MRKREVPESIFIKVLERGLTRGRHWENENDDGGIGVKESMRKVYWRHWKNIYY